MGGGNPRLLSYINVTGLIGTLVSRRVATLNELWTVYGLKDGHDLLEIVAVDSHNEALARKP